MVMPIFYLTSCWFLCTFKALPQGVKLKKMRYLISIVVITVVILSAPFGYGANADAQNSNEEDEISNISQMNFCPSCGAELEEGAKFCHQCGYDLISNPLSEGVEIEKWKTKDKSIYEVSPYAGIFSSLDYASSDYIFGAAICFQKPKYNIDNSIYLHPENGSLYQYFSNKVGIIITPPTPQYELGPFFGVDFEGFFGGGYLIFLGPNIGFYLKFLLGDPIKATLKPSFYISPTWVFGSFEGEPIAGYASTNMVFDFDTRFYFSKNIGFLTNFKLKTGSESAFSFCYLTFGPSFLF